MLTKPISKASTSHFNQLVQCRVNVVTTFHSAGQIPGASFIASKTKYFTTKKRFVAGPTSKARNI